LKLIWIVVGLTIIILVIGGYFSLISGLHELGPMIEQFSAAFGKVIGGIVMIITGVSLTGILVHYYILKRRNKKDSSNANRKD
jgi:uncharacterized membrane protein